MIISHEHKFIFIKTRKTAGTSIEAVLSRYCDAHDVITPIWPPETQLQYPTRAQNYQGFYFPLKDYWQSDQLDRQRILRKFLNRWRYDEHMPAFEVRNAVGNKVWNNYYKFCFERNPWDKVASHYYWKLYKLKYKGIDRNLTFNEYVERKLFEICIDHRMYLIGEQLAVDFVGRFENMQQNLKDALNSVGILYDGWMPHMKAKIRKPHQSYRELYTPFTKSIVAASFQTEIELFGYTF